MKQRNTTANIANKGHRFLLSFLAIVLTLSVFTHCVSAKDASVQEPNWPLKVLSWNLDKAYPGVKYEYRLGVQGGKYPYFFKLLEAPEGMKIHKTMGVISWTAGMNPESHQVRIEISDQNNQKVVHSFTLQVDKEAFRFVATGGNDQNPGTEAQPWATVKHAVKTATNEKYVYIRKGSYPVQFDILGNDCGKLLAYPDEKVNLIGAGEDLNKIGILGSGEYIFQGFDIDVNSGRWFFSVDSEHLVNMIIRKNKLYNIDDDSLENPAFLFFWDGNQTPINGEVHYQNIVVQENIFHDLKNPFDHGASATLYDVQDLIYEDNIAFRIDGSGVLDKDDGFRNTFRNNYFHHNPRGILLANQQTQGMTDVHHNLIHDCGEAISVGWQPGFLRDVYIHHNTIIGSSHFRRVLHNNPDSYNVNIYNNIVGDNLSLPYQFVPIEEGDHYVYPSYVLDPDDDTVRIDRNLVWVSDPNKIAGYDWGIPTMSIDEWHSALFDLNSILADPKLVPGYALPPGSPYFGKYGRDNAHVPLPGTEPAAAYYFHIPIVKNGRPQQKME